MGYLIIKFIVNLIVYMELLNADVTIRIIKNIKIMVEEE